MLFFKRYQIRSFEMGLLFRNGEFRGLLGTGRTGSSTRSTVSRSRSSASAPRS